MRRAYSVKSAAAFAISASSTASMTSVSTNGSLPSPTVTAVEAAAVSIADTAMCDTAGKAALVSTSDRSVAGILDDSHQQARGGSSEPNSEPGPGAPGRSCRRTGTATCRANSSSSGVDGTVTSTGAGSGTTDTMRISVPRVFISDCPVSCFSRVPPRYLFLGVTIGNRR
jgi:hypothetical protein